MTDDQDLDGIDLQAWRVPPPAPVDRSALLVRALSPAAPPRRPRLRWLVAGIVLANAALAALLVIVVGRAPQTRMVTVLPAGGSSVDAQVTEVLQRLEQEQRELESKVREIQDLRALVTQLSEKARQCEERDRTVPKKAAPTTPTAPTAPTVPTVPEVVESCDEVSCVLRNYPGGCCDKYKKTYVPPPRPGLPESLDRAAISAGVASVKAKIATCTGGKGIVKLHVKVGANGLVTNVDVTQTPDAALGACVAAGMARAVFPKTQNGGAFSYPFVF
jgi:hypothetical protein